MGKKLTAIMLSMIILMTGTIFYVSADGDPAIEANTKSDSSKKKLAKTSKSAILVELETGTVLFEKNADEQRQPASITKIMTMALVMEQIQQGKLKYDDLVTASLNAKEMGGTQINLDDGEEMSVYDLLMSVAVASANDSSVALAEHIGGGSEAVFVDLMNKKAAELGMENTEFGNVNGLPKEGHLSSARDVALMSRYLLSFEDAVEFTATDRYPIRSDTDEYLMRNSNALIREYDGCIGTKTGYTQEAGHCLSAAATRGEMTLIAVVLGAETSKGRFQEASELLDYGFNSYTLYDLGIQVEKPLPIPVKRGQQANVSIQAPEETIPKQVIKIGTEPTIDTDYKIEKQIKAPVKEGQVLGSFTVTMDGEPVYQCDYTAQEAVAKRTFFDSLFSFIKRILTL